MLRLRPQFCRQHGNRFAGDCLNSDGIAARLRGLIGGQHLGNLGAVAAKLGVDEVSLRMSIDELAPYPTVDVLAAVIIEYGVDPSWLLTGEYNKSTHRNSAEAARGQAASVIRAMLETPSPTTEQPHQPRIRLVEDG